VLDFEVGKRAHFTINPSSYINMHGGGRDFSGEARFNAIKRFFNEKLEQIERENNLLRRAQIYSSVTCNLFSRFQRNKVQRFLSNVLNFSNRFFCEATILFHISFW
jgi:hypothetical protein